jgi:acyl-CoA reductase-like NAD-dependent aldehyde dehydrogenase
LKPDSLFAVAVVSEGQFVKIKGFLADAKAKGAKFLTGGDTPLSKGYFFSVSASRCVLFCVFLFCVLF